MQIATLRNRKLRIAYDESGAGIPVLMFHSFPLNRGMWVPQLDQLSEYYWTLAPDLPEFGESGTLFPGYTIDTLAEVMIDYLDEMGANVPTIIVGHSTGADIALAIAQRQPQRVKGLVLANPPTETFQREVSPDWQRLFNLARVKHTDERAEDLQQLLAGHTNRPVPGGVKALIRRIVTRQPLAAITQAIYAFQNRSNPRPIIERLGVPILVITGKNDELAPTERARKLAAGIKSCSFLEIPDAGHLSNLDNPSAYNSALRFFLNNLDNPVTSSFPKSVTRSLPVATCNVVPNFAH